MSDLIPIFQPWGGRVLTVLVFVVGISLAIYAIAVRGRTSGRPRCPKCWYDATGLPSELCPECGHTVRRPKDRLRTRRYWKTAIAGLLLAMALPAFVVYRRVNVYGWHYYAYVGPAQWWSSGHLSPRYKANGFTIGVWRDRIPGNTDLRWFCVGGPGGDDVKIEGWKWTIDTEMIDGEEQLRLIDFNENGIPEVVGRDWNLSAKSSDTLYIVELNPDTGPTLIVDHTLFLSDDEFGLHDSNGDGRLEIVNLSMRFAYWKTSFADSPLPTEIWAWRNGKLSVAFDLMKKPLPPAEDRERLAADVCEALAAVEGDGIEYQSYLWKPMVDYVYTGHPLEAREFFDAAWPRGRAGKEAFWNEFIEQAGPTYMNPETWNAASR